MKPRDRAQVLAARTGASVPEVREAIEAAYDVIQWRTGCKPPEGRALRLAQAIIEHERKKRGTGS